MKLLTKDIEEKLKEYPLGSQDGKLGNSKVIAKFFNPTGVGTWYIIEGKLLENGDAEMFGYCHLGDDELAKFGTVVLSELESIQLPMGMTIERDLYIHKEIDLIQALKRDGYQVPDYIKDSYKEQINQNQETIIHLIWTEHKTVTHTKLHININHKTANEMVEQYNFNQEQKNQLAEFQKEEYASMWSAVIYGSSVGSNDIVKVALEQVGNVGGQPFWSWYGFGSRVEWCACFVSWCANQCGYIDSGIIPKFASCQTEGISWFKTCGLWKERDYIPKSRRYYIFRLGK